MSEDTERKSDSLADIIAVQCTGCGCGYRAGIDQDSRRYVRTIYNLQRGMYKFPTCDGCLCHSSLKYDNQPAIKAFRGGDFEVSRYPARTLWQK